MTAATQRPDRCPLRSLLFVPGHRRRWFGPARGSGADGVLFDLQDAVPSAELPTARTAVREALESADADGPRLLVRTAPPADPAHRDDLDAVVLPGLAAVVLPSVDGPEEVRRVDEHLSELERRRGLPAGSVALVPLVETAHAARFAYEIAASSRRVEYMGAGTTPQGDIARALGYRWTPEGSETLTMRSWVLLCVRAAGVRYPLTGLWTDVDDLEGCRRWLVAARDLGFTGSMAIHPSQVEVVNDVFTPTAEQVAEWNDVVEVMAAGQAEGIGAVRFRGRMVDEADVRTARENLALARRWRRS